MHKAAITSHIAFTGSPRLRATMPKDKAPNAVMAAQSNLLRIDMARSRFLYAVSRPDRVAPGTAPGLRKAATLSADAIMRRKARRGIFPRVLDQDDPALDPQHHGLGPAARSQLPEDRRQVVLHRVLRDMKAPCDFLVGEPVREHPEHIHFTRRQRIVELARGRLSSGDPLRLRAGKEAGGEDDQAGGHRLDGGDELCRWRRAGDGARGTAAQELPRPLLRQSVREDQRPRGGGSMRRAR